MVAAEGSQQRGGGMDTDTICCCPDAAIGSYNVMPKEGIWASVWGGHMLSYAAITLCCYGIRGEYSTIVRYKKGRGRIDNNGVRYVVSF